MRCCSTFCVGRRDALAKRICCGHLLQPCRCGHAAVPGIARGRVQGGSASRPQCELRHAHRHREQPKRAPRRRGATLCSVATATAAPPGWASDAAVQRRKRARFAVAGAFLRPIRCKVRFSDNAHVFRGRCRCDIRFRCKMRHREGRSSCCPRSRSFS